MKKSTQKIPAYSLRSVWRNPWHFLAFGFGSGTLPKMPGTWGTLVAIPIYLLCAEFPLWWYAIMTLAAIVLAIIACDITERELGIHDYSGIVLDEIVGYLLTMLGAPVGWLWVILGFVLFRVFDIWKPFPIRWLDRHVSGGFGTVVDDLLAGVYAWIMLQFLAGIYFYYD